MANNARRGALLAVSLFGACLLAVLAGCSGQSDDSSPSRPGPSATRPVSTRPTPMQPSIAAPDRACQGGIPFYAGSPPYAGPGPHKVIGLQLTDERQKQQIIPNNPPNLLPDGWAADQSDFPQVFAVLPTVSDYENAQLALCMSPPQVTGQIAGKCTYGLDPGGGVGVDTDVVAAYYDFTVFEARTGRLIKSFRIDGSSKLGGCPDQIDMGDSGKVAEGIDNKELAAQLQPVVEGSAS